MPSDGSLSCCCWNYFLTRGGIVDEHHNKIKKSQTIQTGKCEREFFTFQFKIKAKLNAHMKWNKVINVETVDQVYPV